VPDLSADQKPAPSAPRQPPKIDSQRRDSQSPSPLPLRKTDERPAPSRDSIGDARAKLSEKRYAEGQRQVTGMIEGLRDRRQRMFRRLWTVSVLVTALSVAALGVELLKITHVASYFSSSTDDPSIVGKSRNSGDADSSPRTPAKSDRPHVWSNGLPGESSDEAPRIEHAVSEKAVIEQVGHTQRQGAWLPGTIADNDPESPDRGEFHDDHQSRTP
jgi:hypothetical protein